MLQLAITNLQTEELSFEVPSTVGKWIFDRVHNYEELAPKIEQGMCANTYLVSNLDVNHATSTATFETLCDEIIDICLVLSFLNARCITPSSTTGNSSVQFMVLGDQFIVPRAIIGFNELNTLSLSGLFSSWISNSYSAFAARSLRLQLSHWLSGLTCFTLEDIYLSVGVQMDIVKQCERKSTGTPGLTYFQGMSSASSRYGLSPLGSDYKNMRNDIVHEGVLSGSNFGGKSKAECSAVIADTLNWLDQYVLSVLGLIGHVTNIPRWSAPHLQSGLPSLSIR